MNRDAGRTSRKILPLIGAIACLLALLPSPALSQPRHLVLLALNDYHAVFRPDGDGVGGLPKAAWTVKNIKDNYSASDDVAVLALEMGDAFSQLPAQADRFAGEPEYGGLTLASFDLGIPGNHEFDNGPDLFASALGFAGFPVICSNFAPGSAPEVESLLGDIRVFDLDGVKVGVFGLLTTEYSSRNYADPDYAAIASARVTTLREAGCTVIIAMTHLGLAADRALAESVDGIDVILGGHSHDLIETPLLVNDTLITQAGAFCRYLGQASLALDGEGKVTGRDWSLIFLDSNVPEDPAVKSFLEPFADAYPEPEEEASGGGGGGCSAPAGSPVLLLLLLPLAAARKRGSS